MIVRAARAQDAEAGAALLCDSIRALCRADHGDDPAAIAAWIANKTAAEFRRWLATPGQSLQVAEAGGRLVGVGLIADEGELRLLYVRPDRVGKGVGKALLSVLEARAREKGARAVRLESTRTALSFYEANGFAEAGRDGLWLTKPLTET